MVLGDLASSTPTLFAYESVELESGLLVGGDDEDRFDCPIVLMADPVVPGVRYLAHHRSGIIFACLKGQKNHCP